MTEKVPENSSKIPARLVEPARGQVPTEKPSLESEIALLLRAEHADPFSLLGPHEVERDGVRRFVIRVLQPYAESVSVILGNDEIAAQRVNAGLFEASLPTGRRPAPAITACAYAGTKAASPKPGMRTPSLQC